MNGNVRPVRYASNQYRLMCKCELQSTRPRSTDLPATPALLVRSAFAPLETDATDQRLHLVSRPDLVVARVVPRCWLEPIASFLTLVWGHNET